MRPARAGADRWPSRSSGSRCRSAAARARARRCPSIAPSSRASSRRGDPPQNALHTVGDRDFALDWTWAAARVVLALGRIATDVVDFSTSEFALVQARRRDRRRLEHDAAEEEPRRLRARARQERRARSGNVVALLTLMKGLASGYNRDQQEDRLPAARGGALWRAAARASSALALPHVDVRRGAGATRARRGLHAGDRPRRGARRTRRAVPRGLQGGGRARRAWRSTRACRLRAIGDGPRPGDRTRLSTRTRSLALDPATAVAAKESFGGTGPRSVDAQIAWLREQADGAVARARRRTGSLDDARRAASSPSRWSDAMTTKRDFLKLTDLTLAEARQVLALSRAGSRREPQRLAARSSSRGGRSPSCSRRRARARACPSRSARRSSGCTRWCSACRAASSGAASRSATRRACSRATATPSCSARRRRRACARWPTATVPVINALSDDGHPVQVLCDVLTVEEQLGAPASRASASRSSATASSNMARSWLEAAPLFGFHLVLGRPGHARAAAPRSRAAGTHVSQVFDQPERAVDGCDVVNTDVWTSMGQEAEAATRARGLRGLDGRRGDAARGQARGDRPALPARPPWRGDRRGDARGPPVARVGPGGEPPARAKGDCSCGCSARPPTCTDRGRRGTRGRRAR